MAPISHEDFKDVLDIAHAENWSRLDILFHVASRIPAIEKQKIEAKENEDKSTRSAPQRKSGDNNNKEKRKFKKYKSPTSVPTSVPEDFRLKIESLGGTETKLVLHKAITKTDTLENHNRLQIPFGQIKNDFLREDEKERLARGESFEQVTVIAPDLDVVQTLDMARWNLNKVEVKNGRKVHKPGSAVYVLRKRWYKDMVVKNGLRPDELVQLWSFRIGEKLCFALVRDGDVDDDEHGGTNVASSVGEA